MDDIVSLFYNKIQDLENKYENNFIVVLDSDFNGRIKLGLIASIDNILKCSI
jgi:hypothetical protein